MENTLYWLWLTNKAGITEKELKGIIGYYKSARAVYEAAEFKIQLSDKALAALKNKNTDKAESIYNEVVRMGGYILTIDDDEYPPLLRNIPNPPYVLYCKGQHMDWKNMLTIAVVGTRRYSSYGMQAAEHMCSGLAKCGAVIVSGMARGIDSISAWAALNNGGKTIAVLGSGIDVVYPPENDALYNTIAQNGVVITEFPPDTKPLRQNFPRRNRIIAGLAYGVLAVQAPKKSGTLITAGKALDFGRDVYAVPASVFEKESEGTNKLIQQGAKAVSDAMDIIEEYPYFEMHTIKNDDVTNKEYPQGGSAPNREQPRAGIEPKKKQPQVDIVPEKKTSVRKLNEEKIAGLQSNELKIVRFLAGGIRHLDEVCRETGRCVNDINASMVMLEVTGYVTKLENNTFVLNSDITEEI